MLRSCESFLQAIQAQRLRLVYYIQYISVPTLKITFFVYWTRIKYLKEYFYALIDVFQVSIQQRQYRKDQQLCKLFRQKHLNNIVQALCQTNCMQNWLKMRIGVNGGINEYLSLIHIHIISAHSNHMCISFSN